MKNSTMYVGLDVHKDSISIATAGEGRRGEIRHYGTIDGELSSLDKVIGKLQSKARHLQFVYEAGPCGYALYRHLSAKGFHCSVIAPSQTPRKAGDRVKTDRRDATALARLERAGELTYVHVPTPEDEAMRDLIRARQDAKRAETRARQQLLALLLRNGIRYAGRTTWTPAHERWISRLKLAVPAQQIAFQEACQRHRRGRRAGPAVNQADRGVGAAVEVGSCRGSASGAQRGGADDGCHHGGGDR